MACDEVGGVHKISGTDGFVAETQVRAGEASGLLGVVCEICLAVFVGVVADNFYGVLVGTYSTVGAETVEFGFECAGVAEGNFGQQGQRSKGNVVYNADGEVVLGHGQSEVFEYAENLGGRCVLRCQTVAATNDDGGVLASIEYFFYIEVQGLAVSAGFFGTVEHGNAFCSCWNSCEQVLGGERTVQMNRYKAYFLAFGDEAVDSFLDCLCYRTHCDDYAFGIRCAVVVEQVVFTAGNLADFGHVAFNNFGNGVIVFVASFAVLEENVAVLGEAAGYGSVGCEGVFTELGQGFLIDKRSEVFLVHCFDFLDFVRCAETVEEVYERHAGLDCRQVCHTGEVHNFLYRAFGKHGEACLAYGHHVLVVAEDGEGVRCDCAGRNMEYCGKKFACNLVHVRNHQQEALRCGVGGGEGTGLK